MVLVKQFLLCKECNHGLPRLLSSRNRKCLKAGYVFWCHFFGSFASRLVRTGTWEEKREKEKRCLFWWRKNFWNVPLKNYRKFIEKVVSFLIIIITIRQSTYAKNTRKKEKIIGKKKWPLKWIKRKGRKRKIPKKINFCEKKRENRKTKTSVK